MSFYLMERGWQDSDFFRGQEFSEMDAWCWMIGEAQWVSSLVNLNGRLMPLKRGQFYSSFRFMAKKFSWSINAVQRYFKKLEMAGMITRKTDTGENLITICKYEEYQEQRNKTNTRVNTPTDTPTDTNYNKDNQITSKQEILGFVSAEAETENQKIEKPKTEKGKRLRAFLDTEGEPIVCKRWGVWSASQGADELFINEQMHMFEDYWNAIPGQKGIKLDWDGTWRNWCRKAMKQKKEKEMRDGLFQQRFIPKR